MKSMILVCVLFASSISFAQLAPAPASAPAAAAPAAAPAPAPAQLVVKDEALVPPDWVQTLVVSVKSLPVIGPISVKVLQWLGVIASILTALCACALVILKALAGVLSVAKLGDLAQKVADLQDSKVMYYLKYLSMFNAQKPDPADQKPAA